jgi:hypothetical protein
VVGKVDPAQKARALLLLGDVQEQLDNPETVVGEVALPVIDLPVAPAPHIAPLRRLRQLLAIEVLRVHPHHKHLLVMGTIEDTDLPPRGETLRIAPKEIVVKLLRRRHLEAMHPDTLRIHPTHHVTDRPVLASRIQRLQDHQHPPRILSRKPSLILRQQPHPLSEQVATLPLLLHAPLEGWVEVPGEPHLRTGLDPERLNELGNSLLTLVGHPPSLSDFRYHPA